MSNVKTEAAKHDDQLLSAVESTLKAHNLRLKPGQDIGTVVEAITSKGIKLDASNGYLNASQSVAGAETAMHVNQVFEGLAKQEPDRFFPREVGNVQSRDALDTEGKIKFIREHGLEAWEKLPAKAQGEQVVVLDQRKLTKSQWLALDRTTRAQLAAQWGADAVGKIMARVK